MVCAGHSRMVARHCTSPLGCKREGMYVDYVCRIHACMCVWFKIIRGTLSLLVDFWLSLWIKKMHPCKEATLRVAQPAIQPNNK